MFNRLLGRLSRDMGVDLGTINVRIYIRKKGIMINEPSVVAINTRTDRIVALGEAARKMFGKAPSYISVVSPLAHGVISDFEVAEKMLKATIERVHRDIFTIIPRPRLLMSIPLDVTEVEKKSAEDVGFQAGAREVFLIEQPMAAAIGARLPVQESIGNFIAEFGGGITQIAVISLGGIVSWKSLQVAGNTLDQDIINYAREKFGLLLGAQSAEEVKKKIGSAWPGKEPQEMEARGRDLVTGLPRQVKLDDTQVREAIQHSLDTIAEAIKNTIEATPPELVADVYERGIILSGGGAMLRGLAKFISKKCHVPAHVADDPLTSVVRGTGLVLEDFTNLKDVLIPSTRE